MDQQIIIAGAAGEGINTLSAFLEKAFKKQGFEIFSYKNYMSRVRGGYNYTTIRVSDIKKYSLIEKADVVIAFNAEAIINAVSHLKEGGLLVASDEMVKNAQLSMSLQGGFDLPDNHFLIDSKKLKETAKRKPSHIMAYAGAVLRLLGIDAGIRDSLNNPKWSEDIRLSNQMAFDFGYELVPESKLADQIPLMPQGQVDDRLLLNGNQSIALGALAAGLSFYCAYPMAPSTSIMNYLAGVERKTSIIVEQAEDEIAAIIAAIGASSNGVRSMTGTSGGGFSLMVEGLGFAAVAETPLVIANVQRPGPATGLPTRTEQADFSFVTYASQGEFPRIVLAPTDVEDCFYTTFRAFNLADQYQCPVILLSDQLLADSDATVPSFQLSELTIERHLSQEKGEGYKRYDFDNLQGGRKYPGMDDDTIVMTDSHVHDEYGYITEEEEAAIRLKDKFLKRQQAIANDLQPPRLITKEAMEQEDIEYILVGWGSTAGVLRDAVEEMENTAILLFHDLFPLPENILDKYQKQGRKWICVEANGTGQFENHLKMLTGVRFDGSIRKYDGRPFTVEYVIKKWHKIREVQNHGK